MKAIIIDDEPDCARLLSLEITKYCPNIEIVDICLKSEDGLLSIITHSPELVFLDIEMPKMNGFQLLDQLDEISFALIFTTAYDEFAVKAFRYSAIDYLLKPILAEELLIAIKKAGNGRTKRSQIFHLKSQLENRGKNNLSEIALLSQYGLSFTQLKEILYCESDNNLTHLYLLNGQTLSLTKTISEIQELLEEYHFLRVHRQYIVNLNLIKKFVKADNAVVLFNNESIPVARSQKDRLMEKFDWL